MEPIYEKDGVKIYRDDYPTNPRTDYDHVGTMVCWHRRYKLGDEQPKEDPDEYLFRLACEVDDELEELFLRVDRADNYLYQYNYDGSAPGKGWHRHSKMLNAARCMVHERCNKALEQYVILDLYLYDHSGITISTAPFSCPWDSGQIGFIYCKKDEGDEACLKAEVKEYDQYLRGEVYGFVKDSEQYTFDERNRVYKNGKVYCRVILEDECELGYVEDLVELLNKADPGEEESCWGFYMPPEELADAVLKGEV